MLVKVNQREEGEKKTPGDIFQPFQKYQHRLRSPYKGRMTCSHRFNPAASSSSALSHRHETIEQGWSILATTEYWCPGWLALFLFFFWVGSRRWNVNKSIMARSWELGLPLWTIKKLFMLPWRAIRVTLAHWRESQITGSALLYFMFHTFSFFFFKQHHFCYFRFFLFSLLNTFSFLLAFSVLHLKQKPMELEIFIF